MIQPDTREILRYLGYRKEPADEVTLEEIGACVRELNDAASPKTYYQEFPLAFEEGYPLIEGVCLKSTSLSRNLKGCTDVIVFCATLGQGVDLLIRRASLTSMAKASVLQAAAAAMIEEVCDRENRKLEEEYETMGRYLRPRFSPGYGDLALETQQDLFRWINPYKNCGISLSASCLMSPSKSVTAFIGVSPYKESCIRKGCVLCGNKDTCSFYKEDDS